MAFDAILVISSSTVYFDHFHSSVHLAPYCIMSSQVTYPGKFSSQQPFSSGRSNMVLPTAIIVVSLARDRQREN